MSRAPPGRAALRAPNLRCSSKANLARSWTGRLAAGRRPFDLFQRLAAASVAPFAAYLRLPGLALVSNSPERFLRVTPAGGALIAETRPIKGTAPRGATQKLSASRFSDEFALIDDDLTA